MDTTLVLTAILAIITFLISELYIKKQLGIKPKRVSKERKKIYTVIDSGLTLLAFGAILFGFLYFETKTTQILPVAFILLAKTLLRGVEEFNTDKPSKAYYHHFLWSVFTVMLIVILWIG
ncbi:DUF4181 domain-containing protein [Halobacillus litoralis]|uniref:DUF4181 domain-containing protein n=1 Tax=Halobacillus litoralis TaxID=45668 RepID=UPI001CD5C26F|nr:DUF4181 domain-containing protein [Halobacillus litoralis]MCA0970764.1 DUF4181 domain-containing protein [Halobacillus litoralis]